MAISIEHSSCGGLSRSSATTTLSAASGAVSALFIDTMIGIATVGEAEFDLTMVMNGCLGGLVGISANCSVVSPWAAVLIGLVYVFSSKLLVNKQKIDDAVDDIPVHFFNGILVCIATGLFADPAKTELAYGSGKNAGLFFTNGNLLVEICGVLFIIALTAGIMTPFFLALNALHGQSIHWIRTQLL